MKARLGNALLLVLLFVAEPLFAQRFPAVSESQRITILEPPTEKPVRMVLDTDTYNEIDDQFAVVYALISPELDVRAVYAAPFTNSRSTGPGDGMEKSHQEILRVLDRLGKSPEGFAYKGSTRYLTDPENPEASPAARDLVERAKKSSPEDPQDARINISRPHCQNPPHVLGDPCAPGSCPAAICGLGFKSVRGQTAQLNIRSGPWANSGEASCGRSTPWTRRNACWCCWARLWWGLSACGVLGRDPGTESAC